MAASIGWYDIDNTTKLTELDMGIVPPGSSFFGQNGSYEEVRAKNDGDQPFTNVGVEIQQAGTYVGYQHLRIAPDDGAGNPGIWQDYAANPLALGGLAVGILEPVHIDIIVPGTATAEAGQTSNLVLIATV